MTDIYREPEVVQNVLKLFVKPRLLSSPVHRRCRRRWILSQLLPAASDSQLIVSRCHVAQLLHVFITRSVQETTSPKYSHGDLNTSLLFMCDQCPPGTFVKHDCTADQKTECAVCPTHHYADGWNSNKECLFCSTVCKELQFLKQECNSTHNRLCECIEGRYLELEFCLPHTKCPPGFGVIQL
ncbi:hypothetical protein FKM82_022776, partial [Ascaphus truei]